MTALPAGWIALGAALLGAWGFTSAFAPALDFPCENPGWQPAGFELQDHSIFQHGQDYYLVSNHLYPDDRFAYARTQDFCSWEDLTPILDGRTPGAWDEKAVWAPFVFVEGDLYYLFYTGVTEALTQSILLATTRDPSDPDSWEPQGLVFQPDHPGMVWSDGAWADCRDPMVVEIAGVYHLYYTGRDQGGGIVGLATAPSAAGPWTDHGAVIPPDPAAMPESASLVRYGGGHYLFYTRSYLGAAFRYGDDPQGPWRDPLPFQPGWAHEFWQDSGGGWFTSYLTNHAVTVAPLTWDGSHLPPWPIIGEEVFPLRLPLLLR